ncbi:SDR family oxidoreductase [Aequorivita sp. H23M31]|uniref:SDR family oxidoreductase n=1 Tax=Aequorivita ciconiae TaxID=2494375 RepID=A0A410G441_9FLAO|nr:SDR family oxidoreductase [Aequorivita sp. H23M31]QAA82023.1 SDR family oxidoreductase [Aequorivita sp. H23M31]
MATSKKKTIVITGGAGGLGSACAEVLKEYKIVISDYSPQDVSRVVEKLIADGFDAVGMACDITKKEDVQKLMAFSVEQGDFGGLIHTAGVSGSGQNIKKVFDIDLVGTDIIIDAFHELATKDAVLILFSSIMGHTVPPDSEYDSALLNPQREDSFSTIAKYVNNDADVMYNFAKRGVLLLLKENAMRIGQKGARIVSVSPGVIMTPMGLKAAEEHPERMNQLKEMTPLGRNGTPEDIAEVVKFLISKKANFITGSDILVDGGIVTQLLKRP